MAAGWDVEDPQLAMSMINVCKAILLAGFLAAFTGSAQTNATLAVAGATPLQWSTRLAQSEIVRLEPKPAKWDYTMGLFTLALLKLDQASSNPHYLAFSQSAVGSLVAPNGTIQGYKREEFQLDALNPGKTLLALWHQTKEPRYRQAAELLYHQLEQQPRTADGGFWHKQRYPNQMWLDGLYMAGPFQAQCAGLFGPAAAFDDAARQIHLVELHTFNATSGLFYHGWDATHTQPWANPATGTSSNFWGRAIGWYAMALVDELDYFPNDHPARPALLATLGKLCTGMAHYQDATSGLWYQVVDQGHRPGNYREATASAMMVYALAKGINHGYLGGEFRPVATRGYAGLIKHLVTLDGPDDWSLQQCCSVAGLGGAPSNGRYRDGSFTYYVSEPVVKNDLKGVGPFILAGIELQGWPNP